MRVLNRAGCRAPHYTQTQDTTVTEGSWMVEIDELARSPMKIAMHARPQCAMATPTLVVAVYTGSKIARKSLSVIAHASSNPRKISKSRAHTAVAAPPPLRHRAVASRSARWPRLKHQVSSEFSCADHAQVPQRQSNSCSSTRRAAISSTRRSSPVSEKRRFRSRTLPLA